MAASFVSPGLQTFLGPDGKPLSLGTVTFYVPGTTTLKSTWADVNQQVQNTNPVALDAAGRASIYGAGLYRQIVKDAAGNTVWDSVVGQKYGNTGIYDSWASLSAQTDVAGASAIIYVDSGTHTDPVVGGTVPNAGAYVYSASPAGWQRVANTIAQDSAAAAASATASANSATASAASATASAASATASASSKTAAQTAATYAEFMVGTNSAYLAPVSTRTNFPDLIQNDNVTVTGFNTGTVHYATEDLTSVKLAYANCFVGTNSGGDMTEKSTGLSDLVLSVGIEYPIGTTTTRVKFGGSNSGNLNKGTTLYSDWVSVTIPKGAKFRVRTYWTKQGGGQVFIPASYFSGGLITDEFNAYDQSGTPGDLSQGTTSAGTTYGDKRCGPQAILAMTSRRSIGLIGDSRYLGVNDSSSTSQYGDIGDITRSIRYYGHLPYGLGSDSTVLWLASHAIRRELLSHCSDIFIGMCTNDIASAGLSGAQILTNTQAIAALFPNARIYATTHYPIAIASTDGFTTLANQSTTNGNNIARNDYNTLLRAGVTGIRTIDLASVIESAPGSNKYRVDKGTLVYTDGTHLLAAGDQWIANSGIVRIPAFGA